MWKIAFLACVVAAAFICSPAVADPDNSKATSGDMEESSRTDIMPLIKQIYNRNWNATLKEMEKIRKESLHSIADMALHMYWIVIQFSWAIVDAFWSVLGFFIDTYPGQLVIYAITGLVMFVVGGMTATTVLSLLGAVFYFSSANTGTYKLNMRSLLHKIGFSPKLLDRNDEGYPLKMSAILGAENKPTVQGQPLMKIQHPVLSNGDRQLPSDHNYLLPFGLSSTHDNSHGDRASHTHPTGNRPRSYGQPSFRSKGTRK